MFGKMKNLFAKPDEALDSAAPPLSLTQAEGDASAMSAAALAQVAKFAKDKKLIFAERAGGRGYTLDGQIQGKPFKIERGSPSREYVQGVELRARCDLGVSPHAVLMIVNRHLKKSLDENTYSAFTDTMETMVNSNLPEEVLWMTMYGEVGWHDLNERFVNDYCILAEDKQIARALIDSKLEKLLSNWPTRRTTNPLVIMLMRGRVYFRMQFDDDSFALDHAIDCLRSFSEQVLAKQALLAAQDQ